MGKFTRVIHKKLCLSSSLDNATSETTTSSVSHIHLLCKINSYHAVHVCLLVSVAVSTVLQQYVESFEYHNELLTKRVHIKRFILTAEELDLKRNKIYDIILKTHTYS